MAVKMLLGEVQDLVAATRDSTISKRVAFEQHAGKKNNTKKSHKRDFRR